MTIYVDAGCSGNPGPTYYRGLNRNGILLFDREFSFGTNNIGEFLAICTGVAYLIERNGGNGSVWSDSKVAITWFNNGRIKTTIERNEKSREIFLCVDKAILYLMSKRRYSKFHPLPEVQWWNTKEKGEIPADYGLKN